MSPAGCWHSSATALRKRRCGVVAPCRLRPAVAWQVCSLRTRKPTIRSATVTREAYGSGKQKGTSYVQNALVRLRVTAAVLRGIRMARPAHRRQRGQVNARTSSTFMRSQPEPFEPNHNSTSRVQAATNAGGTNPSSRARQEGRIMQRRVQRRSRSSSQVTTPRRLRKHRFHVHDHARPARAAGVASTNETESPKRPMKVKYARVQQKRRAR